MSFDIRPAKRENVPLLVGLVGGTGSGKTFTGLLLAKGLAAGRRFCVIDTESGRALHYADDFDFDHMPFEAPFTPARYLEAIKTAEKAGYGVIMVDSMSHEHAGDGGLLEMHDAEVERISKGNEAKRENANMAGWIKPKMEHKKLVSKLLQLRCHLILCFRAEAKVEMVKDSAGKMTVVPKKSLTGLDGWIPIAEKSLPFELTTSLLFVASAPGVPLYIKCEAQHRPFFPTDKQVTEAAGVAIGAWAAGAERPSFDRRIADATTDGELRAVKREMAAAKGTMKPAEIERLRKLLVDRETALAATMTEESVQKMIDAAADVDTIELAQGNIMAVADEEARARLDVNARAKKRTLIDAGKADLDGAGNEGAAG